MKKKLDVVIVGAGFAGIYALYKLRKLGLEVKVLEAAGGIGGTWYWNAYPGARCDVESFQYSYSFDDELQQDWTWTERYAAQPELLAYLQHVVDRYELADYILFDSRVDSAHYDKGHWQIKTADDTWEARYLVMATGCLSKPNQPDFPGLEDFQGRWLHSGIWPQEGIELKNKKVAVVGTGSSGVQLIAEIAPGVEQLTVFQRTPHWVVPTGNRILSEEEIDSVKVGYAEMRDFTRNSLLGMNLVPGEHSALEVSEEERTAAYEQDWEIGGTRFLVSFNDLLVNHEANHTACDFIADKIKTIVKDPATAKVLTPDPEQFPLGARRMVQDDRYYETYNHANVTLVDTLNEPIESIVTNGIKTSAKEYDFDVIIFATGFDAVTGALLNIDMVGREGLTLKDKWQHGPQTYLGVGIAGFPNLFTITGPGSPSVLSNMVLSIEQHIDWISNAIAYTENNGFHSIEPSAESEIIWGQRVIEAAKPTLLYSIGSWWHGSNIPGKPRVFLPYLGVGPYKDKCNEVAADGYSGFVFE